MYAGDLCLWHTAPAPKLFQAAPLGKSKGKEGEKQPP